MSTIKDVAKAANVSISTVSLVLNDSIHVLPDTRTRVWKAIEDYNFVPNQFARSLVTKQKKIIGAVSITRVRPKRTRSFSSVGDTYLFDMLTGIEEEINKTDYSLLLDAAYVDDDQFPAIMSANRVDGMLIAGGFVSKAFVDGLVESDIPAVFLGAHHQGYDNVDTDPEMGIYHAVRHLIEYGHRDIVFINSSEKSQSCTQKMRGFERAMNEFCLPIREGWVTTADFSGQAGYEAIENIWKEGIRPTAVATGYDGISLGVMRFLNEQGIRCPEAISIVGYEDGLIAEYSIPPLTTIRVHKERLGVKALHVLFNRMANPDAELVSTILEPELVVRGSTKPRTIE